MSEEKNGYVTVKTFIVTLAVTLSSAFGTCGAVVAFVYQVHSNSYHAGSMTVERYDQLHARQLEATDAYRHAVSERLARIESKVDRLSP